MRLTSDFARSAVIAVVAALATGCAQSPVMVVERGIPAPDRARKPAPTVSQPTRVTLNSSAGRSEDAERLLVYWKIRKEGM